jgi:hypothetical protein
MCRAVIVCGLAACWLAAPAPGQMTTGIEEPSPLSPAAEKLKALADPEAKAKRKAQERTKPPYEFFRTQIAPFDVLPFVKEGHWATLSVELRSNYEDYNGLLQTSPVRLLDMPHAVAFRREARLIKEQPGKLGLQIMLPSFQKELMLEMTRPGAIRPDGATPALLRKLEPHQMLIPVLGPASPSYTALARFQALLPTSADRDPAQLEKQRYFRLVQPQEPEKPLPLSPHPLTWSTISHVIWDGLDPEALNVGQQQALLDWLHWGGQLIIVGGAGPSLAPLQESFLAPYLPATPSGQNASLTAEDLETFSKSHPIPYWPEEGEAGAIPRYLPDKDDNRIRPTPGNPLFVTGLDPLPGATVLPLGDPGRHALGVEWRVGRGRVLMLGIKLTEPALVAWPGLDTMVRRVVLRRPLEDQIGPRFMVLPATQLTWVRYLARDLDAPRPSPRPEEPTGGGPNYELQLPADPSSAWLDGAALPRATRRSLQEASGITIPGSDFVLKVILAYGIALVPINWLACRFLLRRRELAWVVTPLLALGFAVAVERGAAYDLGFDTACDEIDLVEIQGDYARAHVSRFAALYSTGRHSFTIAYPDDPTALALPMNMANNISGGDALQSYWQTYPEPALVDFPIQPRALSMFRTEQLVNMPGGITLSKEGGERRVVNGTELPLRDAVVVNLGGKMVYRLGTIAPGATVPLQQGSPLTAELNEGLGTDRDDDQAEPKKSDARPDPDKWLDPEPFLRLLRWYSWGRPEDRNEWRLVAWSPGPQPGQDLRPKVDRHRGFRLVVAHLDYGPTPFFDLREGEEAMTPYPAPAEPPTPRPSPSTNPTRQDDPETERP